MGVNRMWLSHHCKCVRLKGDAQRAYHILIFAIVQLGRCWGHDLAIRRTLQNVDDLHVCGKIWQRFPCAVTVQLHEG